MLKDNGECPCCGDGGGILKRKVIDQEFKYKGQKLIIKDYIIYECITCEESFVDPVTLKESEKPKRDFHRKVDGLLTSDEIKNIRVSLKLTPKDFGEILGVSEENFIQYETGTSTQSKTMDNLLRIIDLITPIQIY